MKIILQRETLLKPLQLLSSIIERKQTMHILSNVLMAVQGKELTLTGTDLEVELVARVELDEACKSDGAVTVSARKLLDICRALPEQAKLELIVEGEQMVARSGKSRFLLATLPADEFPNVQETKDTVNLTMRRDKLLNLLKKTHFAMGVQDVRYYLNGSLFDINQGVIRCVATDGHRLAYSATDEDSAKGKELSVILPHKGVMELMRLLEASSSDEVGIAIGDAHFRATTAGFTFTSKLIQAPYPEYNKLIPKNANNSVTVDRESMRQALTRASILLNEKFRGISLQLDKNSMRIFANNPAQEEAEDSLPLDYQGESIEICFNASYLLDVVGAINTENMRWSFIGPNSSVLIEPGVEDGSLYVVMPVRL